MKYRLITLAVFVPFLFLGCDTTDPDSTRSELLTAQSWRLDSFDVDPEDDTVEITLAERYDYESDGTLTVTYAGGQSLTTSWQFADGESQIIVGDDEASQTLEILQLDEELFRFRFEASDVTITATLVHS